MTWAWGISAKENKAKNKIQKNYRMAVAKENFKELF